VGFRTRLAPFPTACASCAVNTTPFPNQTLKASVKQAAQPVDVITESERNDVGKIGGDLWWFQASDDAGIAIAGHYLVLPRIVFAG
jgi:hypothetical protein